jgi:hypothetical protein
MALACAILWATTAASSTYFTAVFEAQGGTACYLRSGNYDVWEVRVFGRVVDKGERAPIGSAEPKLRRWRWRVPVSLAMIGAVLGALVGGHRVWRWRPEARRIRWIGLITSALAFATLVLVGVPWSGGSSLFVRFTDPLIPRPPARSLPDLGELGPEAALLAVAALVIGWAAHTVIAAWGLGLPRGPTADLAADYDDALARPPAGDQPGLRRRRP